MGRAVSTCLRAESTWLCGDLDVALGVVEHRLADVAALVELAVALVLRARVGQVGLRLAQRLVGDRELQLAQLPQPRLALRDADLGLLHQRPRFGGLEDDERLAGLDGLALLDRYLGHGAGDLAADVDAVRRHDASARHDRLHDGAADDLRDVDPRTERRVEAEIAGEHERAHPGEHSPAARPHPREERVHVILVSGRLPARILPAGGGGRMTQVKRPRREVETAID